MSIGLRLKLRTCQAVIIATAILHNIAIDQNCPLPPNENNDLPELPWEPLQPLDPNAAVNARDQLLTEYFANLRQY